MLVTLNPSGDAASLIVPAPVAAMLEWREGTHVNAILGRSRLERKLVRMGGGESLGIYVPMTVIRANAWEIGSKVDLDFLAWRVTNAKPRKGSK